MPLPKPALDNRDFDQLVAEGTARLPRLAPAWTNYNKSDPGITLLELLAARTESSIYRLDRTPPALIRSFLRLTGIEQQRALCAEAIITVSSLDAPQTLPGGIQIGTAALAALFQLSEDMHVSAARLLSVTAAGVDVTAVNATGSGIPGWEAPSGFAALGTDPTLSGAADGVLYLGFDRPLNAPGSPINLYAWTEDPAADRAVRLALIADYNATVAEALVCCPSVNPPAVPDWRLHYSVRTVWEYFGGGTGWSPLADVEDATRALTLSGVIRFTSPAGMQAGGPGAPYATQYFVRCRVIAGTYQCVPLLSRIALNAVAASNAIDLVQPQLLGTSQGHATEIFALDFAPVVPASTRLTVTTASGPDTSWQEVSNWDLSGPHDKHYLLDRTVNTISSGNGAAAHPLPAGAQLTLDYQVGSGTAGNISARSLVQFSPSARNTTLYQAANGGLVPNWANWSIDQPFDALGGADDESLAASESRANDVVFAATRAVTLADFTRLACTVPGIAVARAQALTDYYPELPCFPAAGSVTVVVVPQCCDTRPIPSADFLAGIARYLERRRTLTTEVHVIAPCYMTVVVSATLNLDSGVDATATRAAAILALDNFLDPLTGGADGTGWPIGRAIYRAEIMALLARVPGVLTVTGLGLAFDTDGAPRCGNLPLCPECLALSGSHVLMTSGRPSAPIIDRSKPHECP